MERESRMLEYKLDVTDFRSVAQTVVAFANGDGGRVVVGVRNSPREVVGLSPERIDELMERLPVSLADRIQPPVFPQLYGRSVDDCEVLVVHVFPCGQKPCFIASEGIERGVYVRVGAHTRRAAGAVLEDLRLWRSRMTYDEAPLPGCPAGELATEAAPAVLRTKRGLLSLGVLRHDPFSGTATPTRGGVLMLHPAPDRYVPEAYTVISRMRGDKGRNTFESHDVQGPVPEQADRAAAILAQWLDRALRVRGARFAGERSALPLPAVREAVNNALLHRQYSIPGPTKIALYATRLEVFIPGHFAGPFIPEALGDGTSYIRNHVVCRVARSCRLIEKRGTGIRLMLDVMRDRGLPKPRFEEGPNWFKVTLCMAGSTASDSLEGREQAVLDLLLAKPEIRSSDVCASLAASRATAVAILNRLVDAGRLRRTGRGPATRYLPPDR